MKNAKNTRGHHHPRCLEPETILNIAVSWCQYTLFCSRSRAILCAKRAFMTDKYKLFMYSDACKKHAQIRVFTEHVHVLRDCFKTSFIAHDDFTGHVILVHGVMSYWSWLLTQTCRL